MNRRRKPFPATLASRKMLEADGWVVGSVESQIPHTFIKRDLFGFADLIAMSPTRGIMLIQVTAHTSTSHYHERVRKIKVSAEAGLWLASHGRIQVHSWEKSEMPAGYVGCNRCDFFEDRRDFGEDDRGIRNLCKRCASIIYKGRWCRVLEITSEYDNTK